MNINLIGQVTDVFDAIGEWFARIIPTLLEIFYNTESSQLTILGILAIFGLGMSVIFLLIGLIQNFLHFRG